MPAEIKVLMGTALFIGFFHTITGPDHYLPFIMMSWARKWSGAKTALITFLCGLGHIGSSVILGFIGVALGLAVNKLVNVESFRGNVAAWLLIAFGFAYMIWGIRRAIRNKPHVHRHAHADKLIHEHKHSHSEGHTHVHDADDKSVTTPWILFIIFVFGPCEPLIPILMYPAAQNNFIDLLIVTGVFGTITISTMLAVVFIARTGINLLPLKKVQRYSHAIAGTSILLCGLAIQFLGL